MKTKRIVLMVLAFGLGSWILWAGFTDYQNSQRLAAEGKPATAQVVDRAVRYGSRSGTRYYLSVQFQTEAGASINRRVQVSRSEYDKNQAGSTVPLRYLPADPAICAVGEPFPTWTSRFITGALLLLSGGVLALAGWGRLSTRKTAEKVAAHVGALCVTRFDYAPVNAREFGHLDLGWYDASQRWLEEKGFAWLGDEENLTFRRTSKGNRTLLRTMLGRDGTCLAYLYHFKPAVGGRLVGPSGARIMELQTQFGGGTFICTSNAEAAGKLDSPPGVDALRMSASTSLEAILSAHVQRVNTALANNPGLSATRLGGLEDVHHSQNVLQQIKAAYRRNTGITKEELARLAPQRVDAEQIEALHADVAKLHAERNRASAG
jgi:hypothetical protein